MSRLPADLVVQALRRPDALPQWPLSAWDALLRQARQADLVARIARLLADRGQLAQVPAGPRAHLESARVVERVQQEEVRREVQHIRRALEPLGLRPILLKGAAYLLAGLPAAQGRLFSDVDIMVPHARLPEVEARLMLSGWATTHHSEYDQKYYRLWMHELPPMQHIHRQTVIDVHHAILPSTARLKPDSARLIGAARVVPGEPGLAVLAPADMVLHSMTHLFHNEELSHGLRDLSDLDLLLRHWHDAPDFWQELVARARELDLARPLHYGLHYTRLVLGTPVPAQTLAAAARAAPAPPLAAMMDMLWRRALRSPHHSTADAFSPAALFMLYVRAHWLRMPPWSLVKHLSIKAFSRPEGETPRPSTAQ